MADVYCMYGGAPQLDGQYTVFGQVLEGLDVVNDIQMAETNNNARPLEDIRILRATVLADPTSEEHKTAAADVDARQ